MNTDRQPIRIVQWTTGNVGKRSVIAVATLKSPHLDLVGCYCWSEEKVGKDVGELCGIEPTGVKATNDIDALLALKPDCVVYNPMFPDADELVRILSAGINVVATSYLITGTGTINGIGESRERILEACHKGGATILGTGCNPGYMNFFALVSAGICDRVDKITIIESADSALYDSPETEGPVGFGCPMDDPDLQKKTRNGTAVFEEGICMMADALGVTLDEVTCHAGYSAALDDIDLGSWEIPKGHVAGIQTSWKGIHNGRELLEIRLRWRKDEDIEPPIDVDMEETYRIVVDGVPTITTRAGPFPPDDMEFTSMEDFISLGMVMTAQTAINAIPIVCNAEPALITYADLPIPMPKGFVKP